MTWLITAIALALLFDFLNGFNDSGSIVATIISSGAVSPRKALAIASIAEFCGPFIFGVAVATTIGRDLVDPATVNVMVILAALLSAIGWNLFTWHQGLPSSSSHALIGGIIGAVAISTGISAIQTAGLIKILIALLMAPFLGLLVGYLGLKLILFLASGATPRINLFFKRFQVFTSIALALSHGTNDAQKTMGVITFLLVSFGTQPVFVVPTWVIASCAGAIALGVSIGAWRIIRTLGVGLYRIRPVHGFTAQAAAASVILSAALLGGPVSTTQVMCSSVIGVGSAERISKVRWVVVNNIVAAWLITLPATALIGAILCKTIITVFS
ncbi:MAG: inorganic phosphate transporter [Chloroflexi bacterium]|nr:inorganic phosphate transporter [Chloroflexota bacterium]MCL5074319.1 inorganic phosphate transporter [Chloroflexota bacterium]